MSSLYLRGVTRHFGYISLLRRYSKESAIWARSFPEEGLQSIERNVTLRRHANNVPKIRLILNQLKKNSNNAELVQKLNNEILKLPNVTDPSILKYGEEPYEMIRYINKPSRENCQECTALAKYFVLLRMEKLGNFTGQKGYYFFGPLATMEQAIINHALDILLKEKFQLISVPDIVLPPTIEACGKSLEEQVYQIATGEYLSSTAEYTLAAFFENKIFDERELPLMVTAISRCYRQEPRYRKGLKYEKGIYRVHLFTKLEMFCICADGNSMEMMDILRQLQVKIINSFGFNIRIMDLPPSLLYPSAYRTYDLEVWLPGCNIWGEIGSCSNCVDYQAHRLNIRYRDKNGLVKFVHTVNATAAAIPRLIMAIVENNYDKDGNISVPQPLQDYMKRTVMSKNEIMPALELISTVKLFPE